MHGTSEWPANRTVSQPTGFHSKGQMKAVLLCGSYRHHLNSTAAGQSETNCAFSLPSETTAWENHRVPSCPALPETSGFLITILQSRVTFCKSHVWRRRLEAFSQVCIKSRFFFSFFCQSPRTVGVWVGGLSDMLVRKFPPLVKLLEKGVREMALEKVTGGSCSSAADEKTFKSARIWNSEQRQDTGGSEANFTTLRWAVFASGTSHPAQPLRGICDPPPFQLPAAQGRTLAATQASSPPTRSPKPPFPSLAARVSPLSPLPATRASQLCNLPEIRV